MTAQLAPAAETEFRTWVVTVADLGGARCGECKVSASEQMMLEPSSKSPLCIVCAWKRALAADPQLVVPARILEEMGARP